MTAHDPFRHHPGLRGQIKPASDSYFRSLDVAEVDRRAVANGMDPNWRTPCEVREADRKAFLADRPGGDLWVFGFGSLMWDPSIDFIEVRRAHGRGYQRSFCLWDEGGRGSVANPALMLAIVEGGGCDGLAFRIAADAIEDETFILFRRELIASAYRPVWLGLSTDHGPVTALSFAANIGHERIRPDLPMDQQARMIATAQGFLGTSFDYLNDVHRHLALLGVEDGYVSDLHARVVALRAGP